MSHNDDIFREPASAIEGIDHPEDELLPDEYEDTEEIPRGEQPNSNGAAKKRIAGLAAAGGIVLLMVGFVGYQIIPGLMRSSSGGDTYQPSAPAIQNPYETKPAQIAAAPVQAPNTPTPLPESPSNATAKADPTLVEAQGAQPAITASVPTIIGDPYQQQPANSAGSESTAKADKRLEMLEGRLNSLESKLSQALDATAQKINVARTASDKPANSEARPSSKKAAANKEAPATNTKFHIVSIVSGQAWIEGQASGEVEIVQVGETLSDGTKVTAINATQGVVSTSRGNIVGK